MFLRALFLMWKKSVFFYFQWFTSTAALRQVVGKLENNSRPLFDADTDCLKTIIRSMSMLVKSVYVNFFLFSLFKKKILSTCINTLFCDGLVGLDWHIFFCKRT